ncbi:hypothetical protein GCM10027417_25730 [Glutamicibacter endophyticus]
MQVITPGGCGNSPRSQFTVELFEQWVLGNADPWLPWLTKDFVWWRAGEGITQGPQNVTRMFPGFEAEHAEIGSVITHGRFASCDGFLLGAGVRLDFSHVLRFTGAGKTANIAQVRSYLIESSAERPAPR